MNSFKNTFFLKNKFQNIFDTIVKLEDLFFKDKDINLKTPIFITGMPRSGTTLLTHILHDTKKYGSYLYKDYPFPELPLFWNKFNDYTNAFKIYKKKILLEIMPLISEDFNIFLEIPLKIISRNYKYEVIPISWNGRKKGKSKFKIN